MNAAAVAHRWANKDFGKNGTLTASRSCHAVGRNYFSYSTVFGQWLDLSKNVVAIFDGQTSVTSSKYKLDKGVFPAGVHVFPLDFGSLYSWRNCNLVSEYGFSDENFNGYHRMQMIDHYVDRLYNQFAAIKDGKKKGLENVSFEAWDYITELCSLYKDTSVNKYLKWSAPKNGMSKTQKELINRQRKLARMLKDGERNVEVLTDALFGKGTYQQYWEYCARFRKAAEKRARVEALCERLGIVSPYGRCSRGLRTELDAEQIRKLTAKERVELHFRAIALKESERHYDERNKKYNKNFRNAYKWIVGHEPKKMSYGGGYWQDVHNNCVNKDNGVVYECSGGYIFGFHWCDKSVSFDYDGFRKSEDKEQWIADFYAKCKEVELNRKAIGILKRIKAHKKEKERAFEYDVYLNDDYLRENTTNAEYAICAEFIRKQDKHFADEEARRRAAEIARLKREEEKRKEREYMEQVKQEQIDECLMRGVEGCRDLWRKHLQAINTARLNAPDTDDAFFYHGNVLLRLNLNKDKVETSKDIRIPVDTCKKMWTIVSKWHENPKCFKPMQIDTKGSGTYTISSYKNDILTAGCHKIAYAEMERMYNEIIAAV